jgi:signal transduction histidine kinase
VDRLRRVTGRLRAWLATPLGGAPLGVRPVDVLATAAVITAVQLNSVTATGPGQHPLDAVVYGWGVVVGLPVLARRRWPRGVLVACAVLLLLFYSLDQRDISPAPLLCLPLYDAAAAGYVVLSVIIPVFYLTFGLVLVGATTHESLAALASEFLPSIAVLLLAILLGDTVRSRRALAGQTAERLRLAQEEREAEAARRVAEERLRIARELHDTVAHSMATIAVQAASALHVLDVTGSGAPGSGSPGRGSAGSGAAGPGAAGPGAMGPGTAGSGAAGGSTEAGPGRGVRDALAAIRSTSTAALADMRVTLGELRTGADPVDGSETRTAGLERLNSLADAVRAAGAPVSVIVNGEPARLPPAVDHAAYRILQESLTNVLRHAGPDATAQVRLAYAPGALAIEVTSTGPAPAAPADAGLADTAGPGHALGGPHEAAPGGHGLAGMAERTRSLGGEFAAGPCPGGFAVTARLPLPAHAGQTEPVTEGPGSAPRPPVPTSPSPSDPQPGATQPGATQPGALPAGTPQPTGPAAGRP